MTSKPLVSVILPAYNSEEYLSRSISSILNQTYKNLELIVINDGSTDRTEEVVEKYAETETRIVYCSQENTGPSSARNTGIERSVGEYIAYQDSDDYSYPTRLERQVEFLEGNPTVAMVYTGVLQRLQNGRIERLKPIPFDRLRILHENFVACGSVMHRNEVFDKVGYWNEKIDWDLWIRISEKFLIREMNEILYEYTVRDDSVSVKRGREKNQEIYLQMYRDRYARIGDRFTQKRLKLLKTEIRIGNFLSKRIKEYNVSIMLHRLFKFVKQMQFYYFKILKLQTIKRNRICKTS
jgi:glycosyltransferase involved in cell wall biosynthesis